MTGLPRSICFTFLKSFCVFDMILPMKECLRVYVLGVRVYESYTFVKFFVYISK